MPWVFFILEWIWSFCCSDSFSILGREFLLWIDQPRFADCFGLRVSLLCTLIGINLSVLIVTSVHGEGVSDNTDHHWYDNDAPTDTQGGDDSSERGDCWVIAVAYSSHSNNSHPIHIAIALYRRHLRYSALCNSERESKQYYTNYRASDDKIKRWVFEVAFKAEQ